MFYMAGANVDDFVRDSLFEIKEVGSTKDINVLAQFDTGTEGTSTKRYRLTFLQNAQTVNRLVGRLRMRAPLRAFLTNMFRRRVRRPRLAAAGRNDFDSLMQHNTLGPVLRQVLIGPKTRKCFQESLCDRNDRRRLANNPPFLKPLLLGCVLERDNKSHIGRRDVRPNRGRNDIGSTETGDPLVLNKFIEWGLENYPADHRMVVIWGHGDGTSVAWDATPTSRPIIADIDSSLDRLRAIELREAFSIPKKREHAHFELFDIVGFNACNMGMLEVYYQLRNYVRIGIASEGETPAKSWPYARILRFLEEHPTTRPRRLAEVIVDRYARKYRRHELQCNRNHGRQECSIDLSACDVDVIPRIADAVGTMGSLLRKSVATKDISIVCARRNSQSYHDNQYVDLSHFCQQLLTYCPDRAVRKACRILIDAVRRTVVIKHRRFSLVPNSQGLSIYFPEEEVDRGYSLRLGIKEIPWSSFLREYVKFRRSVSFRGRRCQQLLARRRH
jgi:hypothetical protein